MFFTSKTKSKKLEIRSCGSDASLFSKRIYRKRKAGLKVKFFVKRTVKEDIVAEKFSLKPSVKQSGGAKYFAILAVKFLVPDFLIGHPNLWDNIKSLSKNPQFKPLRMALAAWLIFTMVAGSFGIYSLKSAPKSFASGEAWLAGWQFRKKITISNTNVGSDLAAFPLLVKITADSDMSTALSTGYDIRFAGSDGTTLLPYERETWSGGGGSAVTAIFWVQTSVYQNPGGLFCL